MKIRVDTLRVAGFRGLKDLEIFLPRIAVLIGGNNSGKTSLLKAMGLVLGDYSRYLSEEDFHIGADEKPVGEIVVDARIIPVDSESKRIMEFDDEWTTEFGDKIRSEPNGNQYVAFRTRSNANPLKGGFETLRYILEK
ncbi:MAG: DUF2813 domain-containing protein, partial [Candidatus Pacebacteria bacterium]|nr:DUF2813 domain-containing protein [Candidatus Paceibacterota bacterium]